MKVSVCITVFNEEKSISELLDSLLSQTKMPNEIVIVDGGSTDKTVQIIRHFQKKDKRIKLLVQKCSRAEGRNLGVELAKSDVIAMTDAGCVTKKNWLKRITKPLENKEVDVVAGFYKMVAKNSFQKAASVFLGVAPRNFNIGFLPSTRSIGFRKKTWEEMGGFSENLKDTAEDTMFNYKIMKSGVKISRVKDAIVEWGMPENMVEFYQMIYRYAKGDARSKKWFFPGKGIASHNIKSVFKIFRYSLALLLLIFAFKYSLLWPIVVTIVIVYSLWSFRKVYIEFMDVRVGLWGVIFQYISDYAAMLGFVVGIIGK